MKKVLAFFTAGVLFITSIFAIHVATNRSLNMNNKDFGTWTNTYKDMSYQALSENIGDDTMLVLGSSEFHHGNKTPYHPTHVFEKENVDLMLIGSAYTQSLYQAITVGSVEDKLKNRKVTMIVSPSWFKREGVKPAAFAARFSESEYMAMLENPNISTALKKRIGKKTEKYLASYPTMYERVKRYNKIYIYKKGNMIDSIFYSLRKTFVNEKDKVSVLSALKTTNIHKNRVRQRLSPSRSIDWNVLAGNAAEESKKTANNNFFMIDKYYKKQIEPIMETMKNASTTKSYGESPEYEDFQCFLDLCKEQNIDVQLILLPVNGYWYDYTGFTKETRQKMEDKVKALAEQYNYQLVDFSDEEYTPYFLEDMVHPAGKGWIEINEKINEFYNKN